MAETAINVQAIALTGLETAYAAANADGNYFTNDGKTFLAVNNGGTGSITVTILSQVQCDQGSIHNVAVTVGAGKTKFIGPFSRRFRAEDGAVHVTYSGVTDVTVAAFRLP